ncbi:MAG: ribonuclease D [Colwellia sp.]
MMQYQYIEDEQSLFVLCQQLAKAEVLAIDTEFVRTRTLYPRLGLLQVCDGQTLALIDPVAIQNLTPFWQLLTNTGIVKVLHACSEDLEVFLTAGSIDGKPCKPVNLIDSQIMMSFLGHGLSIGYAAMVEHFTGVELDKSESRTDWTKRPLSERQLTYASADVDYLYAIYPKLLAELEQTGWLDFVKQETQLLIERKFTPINEDLLYQNIKMGWRLNPKQLNSLKHLATWRYQQAKKRDLPLGFVAKENTLMALAKHNPQSYNAMTLLEGVETLDIRHKGKAMLTVLKQADKDEEKHYPKKIMRLDEYPGYKQTFKAVKNFILKISEQHNLAVENLASKKQINHFLSWQFDLNDTRNATATVDIIHGWRGQLFGQQLQTLADNGFA